MELSINLIVSIVVAIAVLLLLSFLVNTYVSGGNEVLLRWITP